MIGGQVSLFSQTGYFLRTGDLTNVCDQARNLSSVLQLQVYNHVAGEGFVAKNQRT